MFLENVILSGPVERPRGVPRPAHRSAQLLAWVGCDVLLLRT